MSGIMMAVWRAFSDGDGGYYLVHGYEQALTLLKSSVTDMIASGTLQEVLQVIYG